MNFQFDDLIGFKIQAEDGEIGSVHDILFDDEAWVVRYIVMDTGGWLLGRKVLVAPSAAYEPDESKRVLQVRLSKQEIKDSPEVPLDPPITREQEALYRDHFQWPYYWGDANAFDRNAMASVAPEATTLGSAQPIPTPQPPIPEASTDPMLRSAREIRGMKVLCGVDEAGEVTDVMVDGSDWEIPHLIVELEHESRKVLLPVSGILDTGWEDKTVNVSLGLNALNSAPVYDETVRRDKLFLQGVADHYDRNI